MQRTILTIVIVAMTAFACIGCSGGRGYEPRFERPNVTVVQLVRARLPGALRPIAVHYWFNAYDARVGRWERWELWQDEGAGASSWGHIHRDLMAPWSNVGGGEAVIEDEWTGEDAERLIATLHRPESYPDRSTYRAWPGPNSNTYVAWVLRESGVSADLGPLGIGKDWRGWIGGGATTTGTGLHFDTPLFGVKLGIVEGVELHVLAFTFGFAFLKPTLKTPFGALSLPAPP
jgi:hypothetical protein